MSKTTLFAFLCSLMLSVVVRADCWVSVTISCNSVVRDAVDCAGDCAGKAEGSVCGSWSQIDDRFLRGRGTPIAPATGFDESTPSENDAYCGNTYRCRCWQLPEGDIAALSGVGAAVLTCQSGDRIVLTELDGTIYDAQYDVGGDACAGVPDPGSPIAAVPEVQ